MGTKNIIDFETGMNDYLNDFRRDNEITAAEICGVMDIISLQVKLTAIETMAGIGEN